MDSSISCVDLCAIGYISYRVELPDNSIESLDELKKQIYHKLALKLE